MAFIAIFSLLSFFGILFNFNPASSGTPIRFLFFLTLFFSLYSVFSLAESIVKSKSNKFASKIIFIHGLLFAFAIIFILLAILFIK